MSQGSLECPRCGGPADEVQPDPRASVRCPWCGAQYERQTAESAVRALKDEIAGWLQRTAGVPATEGAEAVDVATRSFLFNDRILPGLRRDVRRAIDEGIGDVLGSPVLVPPALRNLPGFVGEDCVLLTMRDAILGLRPLRAKLEAPEVSAFATSAADRLELEKLGREIDRAVYASNAAVAIAGEGLAGGAERARHNIDALRATASSSAIEESMAPAEAALTRAIGIRCETLLQTIDALLATPVNVEALQVCGTRLEETAQWLLSHESRDLRGALASSGLHRDAVAVRTLGAIAEEASRVGLPPLRVAEELHAASNLLAGASRSQDAVALVRAWTRQLASLCRGGALPSMQDTSWVAKVVEQATGSGERAERVEVVLAPYWAMPARHAKAEGFFFVSGKQYEGLALVPGSAGEQGTLLLGSQDHLARWVQHALNNHATMNLALDPPCVGPSAARDAAKRVLRAKEFKNVSLGEAQLVFIPVAVAHFQGAKGPRAVTLTMMGPSNAVARDVAERVGLLRRIAAELGQDG